MSISLMKLPYAVDALAPAISEDTLNVHHGKHHKAYVDKVNAAIKDKPADQNTLEQIIGAARGSDQKLFNNAAQTWNHGFYWMSLALTSAGPAGDLAAAIKRDFGSHDALIEELARQGADHFASGWLWLAARDGKLSVMQSHDAETLADQGPQPLLVIDLWEHAYYLDRKNERPKYLDAAFKLLNWDFAADNLTSGQRWVYPADSSAAAAA